MADPVRLANLVVDALDRRDTPRLHTLVPERFWDWFAAYLDEPDGLSTIMRLAGTPRSVTGARLLDANMARLTIVGPAGEAFVTVTFDADDMVKGFALDAEEFEGIGTIVVTCPDERTAELRAFYATLLGEDVRRRPKLRFDEGAGYQPPRWPDPEFPQQMHLDIHVRDLDATHRLVLEHGARLLSDRGAHRTYADPIGHPFCLYPGDADALWRVVIDCPDATVMPAFYADFVRGDPVPEIAFQEISPYRAPRWPDPAFPAQMHFDVKVTDRKNVQERIERLGAARLPPLGGSCPVYADPAGHPFCVCFHGE